MLVCVCACVCAYMRFLCVYTCPANCSAVHLCIQYIRNIFQDQVFKVLAIQSCIWCTLAWCTAVFVNSTTELGLSQMRVKGLEAVCMQVVSPALQRGAGGSRG